MDDCKIVILVHSAWNAHVVIRVKTTAQKG